MTGTPLPRNPADLPAHEPQAMDFSQRLMLAPLEWQANRQGEGFLTCKGTEGRFVLMPERQSNDFITELRFSPGPQPGETPEDCLKNGDGIDERHVEWYQRFNRISSQELGYFHTQALAVQMIEHMRHQMPGMDVGQALVQAGFKFEPLPPQNPINPTRYYRRDLGRTGSFTLEVSQSRVNLTFSKRSSHRWSNLMNLHTVQAHHNGDYAPLAWPATIANPLEAAVGAAIVLADTWRPVVRKRMGAPKP